jgi:hypothetical protein
LYTPQVLAIHPVGQTDSFTAYIKGSYLISQVKTFNHRLVKKIFTLTGDEADVPSDFDARHLPEFVALEQMISELSLSLENHFPEAMAHGVLDSRLYIAKQSAHL